MKTTPNKTTKVVEKPAPPPKVVKKPAPPPKVVEKTAPPPKVVEKPAPKHIQPNITEASPKIKPKKQKTVVLKKRNVEQDQLDKFSQLEGIIQKKSDPTMMSFINSHNERYFNFSENGRIFAYWEDPPKTYTPQPKYAIHTRNILEIKD